MWHDTHAPCDLDAALLRGIERLDAATEALEALLQMRLPRTSYDHEEDPRPEANAALSRIVRFAKSLDNDGEELVAEWFGGKQLSDIDRKQPAKLLLAIERVVSKLDASMVPGAEAHLERLKTHRDRLQRWIESANAVQMKRREARPKLERAREEWNSAYVGAKRLVDTLLRAVGRLDLKKDIFRDLAEARPAKAAG